MKDCCMSVYDKFEPISSLPSDTLNPYILKQTAFSQDSIYKITFPTTRSPYYEPHTEALAIPSNDVAMIGVAGQGGNLVLGLPSSSTLLCIKDELYKRLSWNDLGVKMRRNGMKAQKYKKLAWYVTKLTMTPEVVKELSDKMGAQIFKAVPHNG